MYIKEDLVSKVNKSPFVLMFDESLSQTTKNKQLDVHVCFWDEGQVQSRYLDSKYKGHSTGKTGPQGLGVLLYGWAQCELEMI